MKASLRDHVPALVLIALATALLYARVRHYGYIEFDDLQFVADNEAVRAGLTLSSVRWAFTTLLSANWHPLTWLSHMLDVELFGMDPGAHHAMNAALHAVVGMLFYALGCQCLGRRDSAALAALMFIVHPQHVESVAWLAERKDVLCAIFWLLTMLAWLHWLRAPGPRRYALVLLAFVAALMSKPMAVSLPVVLLLMDIWPLERVRGRGPRELAWLLIEKLPLALLSLAICVITMFGQRESGAMSDFAGLALTIRLGNAVLAYALYLRDFVFPDRLGIFYPLRSINLFTQILPAALALLTVGAVAFWQRRRRPALVIGLCWYAITLLPVIGLIQVGTQARADRYMYIPSMGLLLALASLLPAPPGAAYRRGMLAAAGAVLVWGVLCYMQIGYWESPLTLYQRTAEVTGDNVFAETHLIDQLIGEGRLDEAASRSEQAIARFPVRYEAWMSMGNVLMVRGELAAAEQCFRRARTFAPRQWHLLNNLGVVLYGQGQVAEGCAVLREAVAVSPLSAMIQENLARASCPAP